MNKEIARKVLVGQGWEMGEKVREGVVRQRRVLEE